MQWLPIMLGVGAAVCVVLYLIGTRGDGAKACVERGLDQPPRETEQCPAPDPIETTLAKPGEELSPPVRRAEEPAQNNAMPKLEASSLKHETGPPAEVGTQRPPPIATCGEGPPASDGRGAPAGEAQAQSTSHDLAEGTLEAQTENEAARRPAIPDVEAPPPEGETAQWTEAPARHLPEMATSGVGRTAPYGREGPPGGEAQAETSLHGLAQATEEARPKHADLPPNSEAQPERTAQSELGRAAEKAMVAAAGIGGLGWSSEGRYAPMPMLSGPRQGQNTEQGTSTAVGEKKEAPSAERTDHEAAAEVVPRPPTYRPAGPAAVTNPPRSRRLADTTPTAGSDLRLRVRLVFGRGGVVRNLAFVPERRNGMPSEIEVRGAQGALHFSELRDDCYEPVRLPDAGDALRQGIEWQGRDTAVRWRWVLGGRELYVLGPGDEFGLHGFVSMARLRLNARHVVLATARLREEVLVALWQAGCTAVNIADETSLGVPAGWILFHDVVPTCAIPMGDGRDILNALRPAHEIEPHLVGGVRVGMCTWLAGYPPRIRLTGEFANGFEVKIDGRSAGRASDGAFEAPGWDSEGEHRLWFGDRAETYRICRMDEGWLQWNAYDFGTGAAICGASTCRGAGTPTTQIRVAVSNPLLIGARAGEIFFSPVRKDVRCETIWATAPFAPVWALPSDPAHADKQSARIMLYHLSEPDIDIAVRTGNRAANRRLLLWIAAIHDAGCKGLRLACQDERVVDLWRRYRVAAKQLRRRRR